MHPADEHQTFGLRMRTYFFVDAERRVVFLRADGVLGRAAAVDHMNRLRADPAFAPSFSQVIDFRGVDRVSLCAAETRDLAMKTVFSAESRRAF